MRDINELKKSTYLKKEDCGPQGILVTIKEVTEENLAKQGEKEEWKHILHLVECEKPMVLNPTNGQLIHAFSGIRDMDQWPGMKIVLYNEPSVTNLSGQVVGGIRIRAPRGKAAQSAPPTAKPVKLPPEPIAPQESPDDDDSVPF